MKNELMVMTTPDGQQLDAQTVRNYLVSGKGEVTDKEVALFFKLCELRDLNPWLKEAYLIKYDNNSPAQIVVGKDAFFRKAREIKDCQGYSGGVITQGKDGVLNFTAGVVPVGHELVGGWGEVQIKGWDRPYRVEVSLGEYNSGQSIWKTKPATMIKKVAMVQALREAFPDTLSQLYDEGEMGGAQPPQGEINVTPQKPQEQAPEAPKAQDKPKAPGAPKVAQKPSIVPQNRQPQEIEEPFEAAFFRMADQISSIVGLKNDPDAWPKELKDALSLSTDMKRAQDTQDTMVLELILSRAQIMKPFVGTDREAEVVKKIQPIKDDLLKLEELRESLGVQG